MGTASAATNSGMAKPIALASASGSTLSEVKNSSVASASSRPRANCRPGRAVRNRPSSPRAARKASSTARLEA
jgi:hypothetical protein